MEVSKNAQVTFVAKLVGNVYMLQDPMITGGGTQLSSTLKTVVVKPSSLVLDSAQVDPEERRLGRCGRNASVSPARCSCVRAKSWKSRLDTEDRWVIKFRSDLNLFDLTEL